MFIMDSYYLFHFDAEHVIRHIDFEPNLKNASLNIGIHMNDQNWDNMPISTPSSPLGLGKSNLNCWRTWWNSKSLTKYQESPNHEHWQIKLDRSNHQNHQWENGSKARNFNDVFTFATKNKKTKTETLKTEKWRKWSLALRKLKIVGGNIRNNCIKLLRSCQLPMATQDCPCGR